jgi:mRNA interferase MazF
VGLYTKPILRGQVYWVELDPVRGSEMAKTRPCVVISNDEVNHYRRTVVVVPLTTAKAQAMPPLLLATPSMGENAKARIEHIRSVDKTRLNKLLGEMGQEDLAAIEVALSQILYPNVATIKTPFAFSRHSLTLSPPTSRTEVVKAKVRAQIAKKKGGNP